VFLKGKENLRESEWETGRVKKEGDFFIDRG
jgi:hypothetical protein